MLQDLGIPTANVDSSSLGETLAEAVTGIYAGWASVGSAMEVYPMVMSIGWNPFYGNKEKTAEPWILHHFEHVGRTPDGYVLVRLGFSSGQGISSGQAHA